MGFEIYCDKSHFFCEKCVRRYLKESCDKQYREVGLSDIEGVVNNFENLDDNEIDTFNKQFSDIIRFHKIIKIKSKI